MCAIVGWYHSTTHLELDPATRFESLECPSAQAHWVTDAAMQRACVDEVEWARINPVGLIVINLERAIRWHPNSLSNSKIIRLIQVSCADPPGQDIPRWLDRTQVRAHNLSLRMVVGKLNGPHPGAGT